MMDACSICLELTETLKNCSDVAEKVNLITMKRVHSLRAKAFYNLLKQNSNGVLVLSYDCQKNQVLPKVPDQTAYYSRQMYVYNFTVCRGSPKDPQTKENTFIYSWTEADRPKASN